MQNGSGHTFLLNGSNWIDLGTQSTASANAINNAGLIAGAVPSASGTWEAAILQPFSGAAPTKLGMLPGDVASTASSINNLGQVVGISYQTLTAGPYHGFLYANGTMTSINSLLPPNSGWNITNPVAINDMGQNVAFGDYDGTQHAILLTPGNLPAPPDPNFSPETVPEPSTVVVFGFLGLAYAVRLSATRTQRAIRDAGR
jgi:large repetitive protein